MNGWATKQARDPTPDPAQLEWHGARKFDHYRLSVDATSSPIKVEE